MNRTSPDQPGGWSALAVLALLASLIALGLSAQRQGVWQCLVAVGFGAAILLAAWLCQRTTQQHEMARPLTNRDRVWNAAVFAALLGLMAGLVSWYLRGR